MLRCVRVAAAFGPDIVQPFDATHIDLLLSGLIFLSFQTDHPQNQ
jgi:hypothetical protein